MQAFSDRLLATTADPHAGQLLTAADAELEFQYPLTLPGVTQVNKKPPKLSENICVPEGAFSV